MQNPKENKDAAVPSLPLTELKRDTSPVPGLKSTEKADQFLRLAALPKSVRDQSTAGEEAFSFEKEKIKALRLHESSTVDINDETVQKVKEDILGQYQTSLAQRKRMLSLFKYTTAGSLTMVGLEIPAMFFLLLYLTFQSVPSAQVTLWLGSATLLCLGQLFLLIKSYAVTYLGEQKDFLEIVCYTCWFAVVYGCAAAAFLCALVVPPLSFDQDLQEDHRRVIFRVKVALFVLTLAKIVLQLTLHWIAKRIPADQEGQEVLNSFRAHQPPVTARKLKDGSETSDNP